MSNIQQGNLLKNKNILIIFIISLIFFFIRWGVSFYYLNEEIISKVIFESIDDGSFFYPLIKYLSIADFNNSLNPFIKDLKVMPLPFGSIIIHTIFYKIFNIYGLIFVDLLGIFLFLLIFYNIFLLFNTTNVSIFLSLIFFSIPILLTFFFQDYNFIPLNQFKDFFTLRVHRPFPANLYMFLFVYIILIMNKTIVFKDKYFLFLGVVMALTLSSFYYFFLIEVFTLMIFIIYKFKKKFVSQLLDNYKCIIIFILSFVIISLPFIFVLLFHEKDLTISTGVFDLTIEKKIVLIKYYLVNIFSSKFLIFNFIILLFSFYINKNKINNYQVLNIFNIIYLSSIISPILFILISNKSGILYHFNNNIVIFAFLSVGIATLLFFNNLIQRISRQLIIYPFLFFTLFIFTTNEVNDKKDTNFSRIEFNQITNIIIDQKIDNELDTLLTFDPQLMIWSTLSDNIKYLNLTYVGLTSKNFATIENDLINVFKFLNLDSEDFLKFLENKKNNWRYFNPNVANFFSLRYTANLLNTYKNSKDFPKNLKEFILKTSPIYSQQIVIPNDEFSRLKEKFLYINNELLPQPKIIILNKELSLFKNVRINKNEYCKIYDGDFYILFFLSTEKNNCID